MEKKRLILWIAVILTLAFIFGQSLLDEDVSKKESTSIRTQVVEPVHKAITGEETLPYNVRDAAHILEFSILVFIWFFVVIMLYFINESISCIIFVSVVCVFR